MNLDRCFISKIVETKDFTLIKDLQIKSHFLKGDDRKIFNFINDYFYNNGEVPTERVILKNYPDYDFERLEDGNVGTEEPITYWCDELRTRVKHNKIADIIESSADKLTSGDSEVAYEEIKKGIIYIENEVEETSKVLASDNIEDRKKRYEERKNSGGLIGIPSGIKLLDYMIHGFKNKELITLIASTGIGKSWITTYFCIHAMLAGYKPLLLTTEMSEEAFRDRIEAILMGIKSGGFNYSKFKSGKLDPEEERRYFDFLENKLPKLDDIIIDEAISPTGVNAKIERDKPDIVFVDSVYLMEDDSGSDQDWLRVAHITRDLKKIAKRKGLPIFINSQADSTTSKKLGPELGNIGYARAIGQDSDIVMSLYQDEEMFIDNEMGLKVLKYREGMTGKVFINWDFNTMNFDPIYAENQGKESTEPEEEQEAKPKPKPTSPKKLNPKKDKKDSKTIIKI